MLPREANFSALIKQLGLGDRVVVEAQRIGCLPEKEMEKIFARAQMVTGSPAPSRS
jgi:hypothetical protein